MSHPITAPEVNQCPRFADLLCNCVPVGSESAQQTHGQLHNRLLCNGVPVGTEYAQRRIDSLRMPFKTFVMLEFALGVSAGTGAAARKGSLARSMAVGDSSRHVSQIEDLNERIDRMLLIMQAMWALMEEQGLTEDELLAKIDELDRSDGSADGIARGVPSECSDCGSKVAPGLPRCQICGSEVEGNTSAFR